MPNAIELRELDDDELETRLAEYRRELLNLRFQLATGQLDNVSRLNMVRKDVARVLTILRDREIAELEGRPSGPVIVDRPPRPPRRAAVAAAEEGAGADVDVDDEEVDVDAIGDDVAAAIEEELGEQDDVEELVAEATLATPDADELDDGVAADDEEDG